MNIYSLGYSVDVEKARDGWRVVAYNGRYTVAFWARDYDHMRRKLKRLRWMGASHKGLYTK